MRPLLKLLPKGIQSFEKIINGDYVYVDKTKYVYDIITSGSYYFLCRPRRFGKSVLLATLKELFEANRSLFKGLWIDRSDYQWTPCSVIHLSLSDMAHTSVQAFCNDLVWTLQQLSLIHI